MKKKNDNSINEKTRREIGELTEMAYEFREDKKKGRKSK